MYAQSGTSQIRGTVFDPQGKVVPGATVTLTDTEKNFTRTQTSASNGTYTFTAVPPGNYRIDVESSGFKKGVLSDVKALVDTPTELDVHLEVGNVTESVTVSAAGGEALLNTTDATIGNTFESKRIVDLPLNARNVVGLLSLQPGVTQAGYVNGGRADQSNITLDGVDVNEQQNGLDIKTGEAFAAVLRSTPDSLQEFRVTTTNGNADQGRSSGAQVSLITKSGTNVYHGSLYEFNRNTVFSANDWFSNKSGLPRAQLLRNIFGGSFGGPIKQDKAFFFFTYEGFREATATPVVRQVPLPTLGQGIVRYFTADGASDPSCPAGTPSGVACLTRAQISAAYVASNGINPGTNSAALAVLATAAGKYKANDTSVGDGLNTSGFRFNANTPSSLNAAIAKFDVNLTSKQTIFIRTNYQQDNFAQASRFPDTPGANLWAHPIGIAAGHTWTISNNLINRFTYGYTRAALTSGGDSQANSISFRFIFSPLNFSRGLERTTPVHNIVDDISYIRNNHTFQVGANVRLISNARNNFGGAFDTAVTNPSFYDNSGLDVTVNPNTGDDIFPNVGSVSSTDLRDALTAVIGRYSQFSTNINYGPDGKLLTAGTPAFRNFATQEYEFYGQDQWRFRPNLLLTLGLRWSTSTPVYETNGVEVSPTPSLGSYFEQRVTSAANGVPFNGTVSVDKSGKKNGKPGYYEQDWNNFAPVIAAAWSPNFRSGFLGSVLGHDGTSSIRGGYRLTYDRIGSQLAVTFDGGSTLGFHSNVGIAANTFNVSDRLGPLFTGFNQDVRGLLTAGGITIPGTVTFPLITPADQQQRIESSLDDTLTTPYNHNVNLTFERQLGRGLTLHASYVGRFARNLLATRDVMHLNNIRDPKSGLTWYQAMGKLTDLRYQDVPITSVQPMSFFENLFPGLAGTFNILGVPTALTATQAAYRRVALPNVGGRNTTDYTFIQLLWDDKPISAFNNTFFQPQYAAFSAFSTIARSNYNALQVSLTQRLTKDVTFDFNYTYGHSLDNASGLQNSGTFGSAFIVNPLNINSSYANSDFDVRHNVNANWVIGLPVGKGKKFLGTSSRAMDMVFGGWQLTGVFRWNSGLVSGEPFEADRWATNWNVQSNMVRVRPLLSSPTRGGNGQDPNLFGDPTFAVQSFRDPSAGDIGDRNILREPGYFALDSGLYKNFKVTERVNVQFRWEVFNVTNTQRFTGIADLSLQQDPFLGPKFPNNFDGSPSPDFGKFTTTQSPINENKAGRLMQFALKINF